MEDKNGVKLKTGQIVLVSGGYFKRDNGEFMITHSPEDPNWSGYDYCMVKRNKNGTISKNNIAFWPLMITVSSNEKRALARAFNEKNAEIEVIRQLETKIVKITEKTRHCTREYEEVVTPERLKELEEKKNDWFDFEII